MNTSATPALRPRNLGPVEHEVDAGRQVGKRRISASSALIVQSVDLRCSSLRAVSREMGPVGWPAKTDHDPSVSDGVGTLRTDPGARQAPTLRREDRLGRASAELITNHGHERCNRSDPSNRVASTSPHSHIRRGPLKYRREAHISLQPSSPLIRSSTAREIGETRSRSTIPLARRVGPGSEGQVEPKCFVEFGTQWAVEGADQRSDALDIDRSNLLRLSFRVAWQPG